MSPGSSSQARIALIAAASVIAATGALLPYGGQPVNTVAAVALVLILPGAPVAATFMAFMWPLERVAVTLAASIAITALTVLALDVAKVDLDATAFVLALTGASLLSCLICSLVPAQTPKARGHKPLSRSRLAPVWFGAFVLLIAGAGVVSGFSIGRGNGEYGFTQLWALPKETSPIPAAVVGVGNRTGAAQEYFARLKINGEQFTTWGPFQLADGESATEETVIPSAGRFDVVLRIGEDHAQVRTVHFMTR